MNDSPQSKSMNYTKILFVLLFMISMMPFISPGIALFMGLAMALTFKNPYPHFSKKLSKILLQVAVVGLGFGMDLHAALETGKEGMLFTIVSVCSVLIVGTLLGRVLKLNKKASYLIAAGTAICGGSAIAAVGPVIKANDEEMTLSIGTIFVLNAVALFLFPPLGELLGMTQQQFGLWSAMAIHDTSSVVGAGAAFGPEALEVATMVKLTRALWIIPVCLITAFLFKEKGGRISYPWFILFFVLAMLINTYFPLPPVLTQSLLFLSKRALSVTLFLIGAGLSLAVVRKVGMRPMLLGVTLWIFITVVSLLVIL